MKLLAIERPSQVANKRYRSQDDRVIWVALTVIIAFILWFVLFFLGYWLINQLDDKAYYRIATKGKFEEDMYFKGADMKGISITPIVTRILDNGITYTRTQDIFSDLLKYEKEFVDGISTDKDYMNYLKEIGSTVEDVTFYVRVIADLDNIMLKASSYIVSVVLILAFYFVFKYRIRMYILTALLYFFLIADGLTSGLISSAMYPYITNEMEYTDYMMLINSFLPAVKEAALTFIILDTSIQHFKNSKQKKEKAILRYAYYSLEKSIATMTQIQKHSPNIKIKDINVKLEPIYHFCKKHQDDKYLSMVKTEFDKLSELNPINYSNSQLLEFARYTILNLKKSVTFIGEIVS